MSAGLQQKDGTCQATTFSTESRFAFAGVSNVPRTCRIKFTQSFFIECRQEKMFFGYLINDEKGVLSGKVPGEDASEQEKSALR